MEKEIRRKIKIPSLRKIIIFLKDKFKKLFSWCFLYLKKSFQRAVSDIKSKKWRGLVVILLSVLSYFLWGLSSALLWFLFLAFFAYGWESRIVAAFALICLAICPILLSLKKDALAEQMAIYAYYFLVMTVVLQIKEYREELKNRLRNLSKFKN